MPGYKYLIIGGGMTAAAAIKGIREVDASGSIGLVGNEADPPYKRPPLSKKLWQGKPIETVWKGMSTDGVDGLDMHLGHTIQSIYPTERYAVDEEGTHYTYEKLLLATGGTPRRLPFGGDRIIYFRSLDDYRHLKALTESQQRFAVIGGGFIGSEIAAALAMNGKDVTMIVPEQGIGERIYPPDLVQHLNSYYEQKGVKVLTGERAVSLNPLDETDGAHGTGVAFELKLGSGQVITVDSVVAGIGIIVNTGLAEAAGLRLDNGIVVGEHLRTSDPNIYAAGDVASYPDYILGVRRRVEHEDNANSMGKAAGRSMAASAMQSTPEPYRHTPFFYSDMFDLGYEAVGELDSRLEMVADWKEPYKEGVIYYLRDGRVRGVLLWNVWGQLEAARRLISEQGPFTAEALYGRLPAVASVTAAAGVVAEVGAK
ncbi:MAG: FAD-dependent oxidoreductase [Chloroflexi bacterium]|nr:FAD-dependent oxidoreductase [Chloroflexota bacterium]